MGLSVLFAYLGFGAYSFVLPLLITGAAYAMVLFFLTKPPIRLQPEFARWPSLAGLSSLVLLARILSRIILQGDTIILGLVYATEVVGIYYFAYGLSVQAVVLF